MARMPSIDRVADDILARIEQDELAKTANLSYTRGTARETQLGQQMKKVAELVRDTAEDNQISYSDLVEFRRRHGI